MKCCVDLIEVGTYVCDKNQFHCWLASILCFIGRTVRYIGAFINMYVPVAQSTISHRRLYVGKV